LYLAQATPVWLGLSKALAILGLLEQDTTDA